MLIDKCYTVQIRDIYIYIYIYIERERERERETDRQTDRVHNFCNVTLLALKEREILYV